jgi:tRNA(Ile)-lysidine synthase TilS/MesJ
MHHVAEYHLRPLNHCPEWDVRKVLPIRGNLFIEAISNPFYQEKYSLSGRNLRHQTQPPEWDVHKLLSVLIHNFGLCLILHFVIAEILLPLRWECNQN